MARLAHRQLLVVDSNVDTLELFKVAFQGEGAIVVTVTSASEALTTLHQRPFHGLLSELVLPDLSGWDFLRRVRSQTALKQELIPAIAVTGLVTQTTEQDIQVAGYAGYFPKPVELDELIAAMAVLTDLDVTH